VHRRIFRPVTEPSRPDDSRAAPPTAERVRCPRCGATLGRLAAGPSDPAPDLYCGCCGLVLPAGVTAAR
jgi:transposase